MLLNKKTHQQYGKTDATIHCLMFDPDHCLLTTLEKHINVKQLNLFAHLLKFLEYTRFDYTHNHCEII